MVCQLEITKASAKEGPQVAKLLASGDAFVLILRLRTAPRSSAISADVAVEALEL